MHVIMNIDHLIILIYTIIYVILIVHTVSSKVIADIIYLEGT